MMLWTTDTIYLEEPFGLEKDLESVILEVSKDLFGDDRIYLDIKKMIGRRGQIRNIPDGYLIDLSSKKEPKLFLVENELIKHDPLKHIAAQVLEFSLSFVTTPQKIKTFIKEALISDNNAHEKCLQYVDKNGFENIDYLLEKMIYGENKFNVLVIIDEVSNDLENALMKQFRFPVEILTLQRFKSYEGNRIYQFEPFLADVSTISDTNKKEFVTNTKTIDPSEIDTIVVPARKDGFEDTFLSKDCWHAIRMHPSMISKIKYIAAYRIAPDSAITHIAKVKSIELWKDTNKYILSFTEPAKEIGPLKLVHKGTVKALQNSRYTSYEKLKNAKTLDDAF